MIEHVEDDLVFATEIKRLLKPGGTAYISTVVKKWYGWYLYRNNGRWVLDPTHVREYNSIQQFTSIIEDAGLEVQKVNAERTQFSPLNFILRAINRVHKVKDIQTMVSQNKLLVILSMIRIPIIGYQTVEAIARK